MARATDLVKVLGKAQEMGQRMGQLKVLKKEQGMVPMMVRGMVLVKGQE